MVYCDYVSNTENSVTYSYGGLTSDITGIVIFYLDKDMLEIVKEPSASHVSLRYMYSLFNYNRADFHRGVFKPKISYEI